MPLYKNEPFYKKKPPSDLDPDEEVFFCSTTYEIFRDYDEFFDRTILVNSVVWSCDICSRGDLTYQEAIECATEDKKQLDQYSNGLTRALLWILRKTKQSNLKILSEEILAFVKERYFIEEKVEFFTHGVKNFTEGFIHRVVTGTKTGSVASSSKSNRVIDLTESDDNKSLTSNEEEKGSTAICVPVADLPNPTGCYYLVKDEVSGNTHFVPFSNVRRSKNLISREALKFFVKQTCEMKKDFYAVKKEFADKHRLDRLKWTDIYSGPIPIFQQKNKLKNHQKTLKHSAVIDLSQASNSTKGSLKKSSSSSSMNGLDSSIEAVLQGAGSSPSRLKEDKHHYATANEMMRSQERLVMEQRAVDIQKREEDRLARNREREFKREEKRQRFLLEKEWLNARDDLDLLDLKTLPHFHPVQTHIPNAQFGDALMLLEFLHRFSSVFDLTSNLPSNSVSLDDLQKALTSRDPNGVFTDILFAFLTSLQVVSEQESEVERTLPTSLNDLELASPTKLNASSASSHDVLSQNPTRPTSSTNNQHLLRLCHNGRRLARLVLGESERELDLDSLTVTEVLRIFLLSTSDRALHSTWAKRSPSAKLGLDEPTLAFIRAYPDIMEKLETDNVFDLSVGEKLRILVCLMEQLLVSLSAKDAVDTSFDTLRQLKAEMRQLTYDLLKAERDLAALKWNGKLKSKPKTFDANGDVEPEPAIVTFTLPNSNHMIILSPGVTEKDYMRAHDTLNKLRESTAEKEVELLRNLFQATGGCQLMSLGQDRLYRRYWIVNNMPGLFIEDSQRELLPQIHTSSQSVSTNHNSSPSNTCALRVRYKQASSDEMELFDSLTLEELKRVVKSEKIDYRNANSSQLADHLSCPSVRQVEECRENQVAWSFYLPSKSVGPDGTPIEADNLNELLTALHLRGYREAALHKSILELRDLVEEKVTDTNVADLTCCKNGESNLLVEPAATRYRTKRTLCAHQSANNWLEVTFRESLLDLEERLYRGNLGHVKTDNRDAWRQRIVSQMVHQQDLLPDEEEQSERQTTAMDSQTEKKLKNCETVSELCQALVAVAEGINSKYFVAPLGEDDEQTKQVKIMAAARAKAEKELEKDEENEDNETRLAREEAIGKGQSTWERWCHVTRRARSVSQLLLHLSSLERSVRWAKSILKTYCRSCRRKGDDNLLLLCDSCDAGYHTYCLKPPLSKIPQGDWFCQRCRPLKPLPHKITKKRVAIEESSDEEDKEVSNNEDDNKEEEDKEEESDAEEEENAESAKETEDSKSDTESENEKENEIEAEKRKRRRGQITLTTNRKAAASNNSRKSNSKTKRSSAAANASSNSRRNSTQQGTRSGQRAQRNSLPAQSNRTNLVQQTDSRSSLGSQKEKKFTSRKRGNADAIAFRNCEALVSELSESGDIWPFREPVNKREAPDYKKIVSHPMDMRTIKVKINKFHYTNAGEILADLKLMLSNCELYNKSSSEEYKCSQRLTRHLESRIKELQLSEVAKSSGTFQSPPRKRTRTK